MQFGVNVTGEICRLLKANGRLVEPKMSYCATQRASLKGRKWNDPREMNSHKRGGGGEARIPDLRGQLPT